MVDDVRVRARRRCRDEAASLAATEPAPPSLQVLPTLTSNMPRYPRTRGRGPLPPPSAPLATSTRSTESNPRPPFGLFVVRSKSRLGREGDSLLRSLVTVTSRTTNGLARAVNVTGTAASVVAGGAFKLAGAAVLDAVGEEMVTGWWSGEKKRGDRPLRCTSFLIRSPVALYLFFDMVARCVVPLLWDGRPLRYTFLGWSPAALEYLCLR